MKGFILDLDKPRKLVFDFDAWDVIAGKYWPKEDKGGFDVSKLEISARELPFLAFAGLIWEDPGLTEESTKVLLNAAIREGKCSILSILNVVSDAIFAQSGLQKVPVELGEAEKKAKGPTALIPASRKRGK